MFRRAVSSFGAHGARVFAAYSARSFSTVSNVANRTVGSSSVKAGVAMMGALSLSLFGINTVALAGSNDNSVPVEGVYGTNQERTFIALKPDAVQRGLIGKIIQRFEEKGYKLVALKLIHPTQSQAEGHYSDLKTKPFFSGLVKYFSSGGIVAMVWEGKGVISGGRKLLGETDPAKSAPGSIRGDYSIEVGRNIIHGSDGQESAAHEIKFWFTEKEVLNWKSVSASWIYEKP